MRFPVHLGPLVISDPQFLFSILSQDFDKLYNPEKNEFLKHSDGKIDEDSKDWVVKSETVHILDPEVGKLIFILQFGWRKHAR